MRLDRSITLGVVQPIRDAWYRPERRPSAGTMVPVLMYHSISDDPEPGASPYYQVNTRPAVFRQHMQFLADHGYHTFTVDALVRWLAGSESSALGGRPVVITFDDGFLDFYTVAFPVLQQHGFTATMFLPTAFIGAGPSRATGQPSGTTAPGRLSFNGRQCLSWNEITELRKVGIEFGSHTVNHPKLVQLSWHEIKSEISDSKVEIEQHLGEPVHSFCYPYAFPQRAPDFIKRLSGLLSEAGYQSCATTELGRVRREDDPLRLKRLPANSLDDPALLSAKLEGAYDWLIWPQLLRKYLTGLLRECSENRLGC